MKIDLIVPIFLVIFGVCSAEASSYPLKFVTANGSEFVKVSTPTAMGVSYRAPNGLVWGDLVVGHENGKTWAELVDFDQAANYCGSIKFGNKVARVPSLEDFKYLADSMSTRPSDWPRGNETYDPSLPALPNLVDAPWLNPNNFVGLYMTSTTYNSVGYSAYEFDVTRGLLQPTYKWKEYTHLRCIIDL